jgi:hypothetical protein
LLIQIEYPGKNPGQLNFNNNELKTKVGINVQHQNPNHSREQSTQNIAHLKGSKKPRKNVACSKSRPAATNSAFLDAPN